MATTLDTLQIEVTVDSKQAEKSLNTLKDKVEDLSSASGSVKNVAKQLGLGSITKGNIASIGTLPYKSNPRPSRTPSSVNEPMMDTSGTTVEANKTSKAIQILTQGFKGLADSASGAVAKMGGVISSLKRIAMYRVLRTVLKEISQSFTEGLKNAYTFDKEFNNGAYGLASAMDMMVTKSQTMRNQLGAAFAGLLQSIMPIILKLISWITTLANAISQLFAIFSGKSTYLKAVDSAKSFADSTSSAAGSAKELKKTLLGFDEINKLDDNSSTSGGGGGGSSDIGNMFEETAIDEWAEKLKDKLGLIKALALGIGAAILAWKIAKPFLEAANLLGSSFSKILGVLMTIAGTALMVYEGIRMWKDGVDWEGVIGYAVGLGIAVAGLVLTFGKIGAAIGLLIGGIGALVIGFKDLITTGKLTAENSSLICIGILAVGAAISLLTGSFIPMLVAGIAVALVGIVGLIQEKWGSLGAWWDSVKSWASNTASSIGSWFSDRASDVTSFVDKVKDKFENLKDKVLTIKDNIKSGIEQGFNAIKSFIAGFRFPNIKLPHLSISWKATSSSLAKFFGISSLPSISCSWYANGGFPDAGQLFIANENGAEMVGSMDGRTAVANNEQIIEGIRRGVTEAMMNVMSSTNGRQDIRVYLDSREIKAGQRRLSMAMGV